MKMDKLPGFDETVSAHMAGLGPAAYERSLWMQVEPCSLERDAQSKRKSGCRLQEAAVVQKRISTTDAA